MMLRNSAIFSLLIVSLAGCVAPRVKPLTGVPSQVALPQTPLPAAHTRLVFRWEYGDPLFSAKGEGVARIAPPDSVRLDFFSDGNLGGGYAILIGDSLFTPANGDAGRYLPPVPLLWASVGRLEVAGRDTTLRTDGDTLRAEINSASSWRAALVGRTLVSVQRIEGGRLRESVVRSPTVISYRNHGARRRLTLTVLRRLEDPPFDEAIWRR
ncbi:MAG: hypothetical protein ABIT38_10760 [Gemmatimonadaceae bacterium]